MARLGLNPGRLVPQSVPLAELEVQHGDGVRALFEFRKPQCCALQVKELDFFVLLRQEQRHGVSLFVLGERGWCPLGE